MATELYNAQELVLIKKTHARFYSMSFKTAIPLLKGKIIDSQEWDKNVCTVQDTLAADGGIIISWSDIYSA